MNVNTQVKPEDELVFNVGPEAGQTQVKEVKDLPKLTLVPENHPILREVMPSYDFESEKPEERAAFAESMLAHMTGTGGIGLSANQVGHRKRMFVMIHFPKDGKPEPLVCYNPEVIRELEPPKAMREGCLSFPGLSLQVKRPAAVEVSFQDHNGQFFEIELEGINAQCFQHELDHMNGIVFTSRVNREILDWERAKQRKLVKKAKKLHKKGLLRV